VFCSLLFSFETLAAEEGDRPNLSPQELLKQSNSKMRHGQVDEAISLMFDYLASVADSKLPRVRVTAQEVRFKLARILIQRNNLKKAVPVLEEYIAQGMGKRRTAMKMLASCLYETEQYEACAKATQAALDYNENPDAEASVVKKGKKGKKLVQVKKKDDDPEYTPKEIVILNMYLAESLYNLSKWEECIPPYRYVIKHGENDQRKGLAIMQVINALINIPDYDRILAWIPQLYRTDARYNIRVNMALMKVADSLYRVEKYDSALPLYRMIIPKEELLAFQEEKLRKMRIDAGLIPQENVEMTEEEKLLFGDDEDDSGSVFAKKGEEDAPKEEVKIPPEIQKLERLVNALRDLPPYENNVAFRMAELYQAVDRYWEAFTFFDRVYQADPDTDLGAASIREMLTVLLEDLKEQARAEKYAFDYLAKHKEGLAPRLVAYKLTIYYQKKKEMKKLLKLRPYVDALVRTNDTTILTYDTELYFMQAVADLMTMDYKQAEKDFKFVLDEFGDSRQKDSSTYWYGMSILFQQRYAEALPIFEKYIKEFPEGKWVPNSYFQKALCTFGQSKYEEAKKGFTYVIEHFPKSDVFPDACSMRGDLYGAESLLDEALADYQTAIKAAKKVKQATYAVFRSAEIYEADETIKNNNNKIIEVVQQYLDTWGDQADIAKALFWIGKTRIQQGFVDEAVQTYIDAIVKYGSNLQQDGVDLMIAELVKISAIWLGVEKQEQLLKDLQTAMDLTDNPTVKLRLRVTIAMLTHSEVELGKQLLKELPSLDDAPPPVLSIICDASFEMEDYSRAKEILKIFQSKFEDSKYMRDAYKLRAYGQFAQKDYTNTLETIRETQETYGTEPDVAWAQLMKAQIYLDRGELDKAREANLLVLGEANWRGDPFAQATYQLGQVAEREGDPLRAFGFYQRTYFQFKGYANGYWAAEAYLASARCLKKLNRPNDVRNTYRAMLYDNFVNDLPQAEVARKSLRPSEVLEIERYLKNGGQTNITVLVENKEAAPAVSEPEAESTETQNETPTSEEPAPENQTQTEGE